MQKIKDLFKFLLDSDFNDIRIRIIFYLLAGTVAFFIFMNLGGENIFWKIIAKLKVLKMKRIGGKPGLSSSQKEETPPEEEKESGIFSGSPGNFLTIYFAIKSSLKNIAQKLSEEKLEDEDSAIKFLRGKKILNRNGLKKLKILSWVASKINKGKIKYIENIIMKDATKLAWDFHREINVWMRNSIK